MNGWTNRETWLVNLWISEGAIGDPQDADEQGRYYAERYEKHNATYRMAQWLKEQVTTIGCGEVGDGLAADLLGAALAAVNWDEIAEHYVEDAIRNEAEQTEYANA